jgi:hypothetical protein
MQQVYTAQIKPFLVAQMARIERQLKPSQPAKKPGKGTPEKLDSDKIVKNFILETVTHLIECINDRQEEANILRSISSKYENETDA